MVDMIVTKDFGDESDDQRGFTKTEHQGGSTKSATSFRICDILNDKHVVELSEIKHLEISENSYERSEGPLSVDAEPRSKRSSFESGRYVKQKKNRKARTAFSDSQLQTLEKSFERQQYLSVQDRVELASKLRLSDTQVKTWYQNRRTKWKRQTAVGLELLAEASNYNAFQRMLHSNPYYWSTYISGCPPFCQTEFQQKSHQLRFHVPPVAPANPINSTLPKIVPTMNNLGLNYNNNGTKL